ncbi:MAG: HAMP domain-containing histidine kinase [Marinilabiliaceae bacterium]|nr:HAMP domain-containing histidine kinase [Marinilabiliaceae bacterium]
MYYQFVFKPTETVVKEKILQEFETKMALKIFLIENTISKAIEGAKSISSRTMIRNKAIEFFNNKTSVDELRTYSNQKFQDGVKPLKNCIYAVRYVNDERVAECIKDSVNKYYDYSLKNCGNDIDISVFLNNDSMRVQIISPIKFNEMVYGYDVLVFLYNTVINEISDKTETLHICKIIDKNNDTTLIEHFTFSEDTMVMNADSVYYYSYSNEAPILYSISKDKECVFNELQRLKIRHLSFFFLISISVISIFEIIRKRTQLIFLKKSEILENLVSEKTNNLADAVIKLETTNKQLREREEELIISNHTKDRFFSILAHDLISPLKTVTNLMGFLKDDYLVFDDEKRLKYINVIHDSLWNNQKLLENLLEWSRLQQGAIVVNLTNVVLHNVVEEIRQLLSIQIVNKKLHLKNNIKPGQTFCVDYNILHTVLRNLISNAVKYTNEGGVIDIGFSECTDGADKRYFEFVVKDNGVGMNEHTLSKIFKIGETVSMKGTCNEPGTGLGLILCRQLVEKHGGKIWAETKSNEGSTFRFQIPDSTKCN